MRTSVRAAKVQRAVRFFPTSFRGSYAELCTATGDAVESVGHNVLQTFEAAVVMIPQYPAQGLVVPLGRINGNLISILGTSFLLPKKGCLATAAHVAGNDDDNLVVVLSELQSLTDYQIPVRSNVKAVPVRTVVVDPFRDLAIVQGAFESHWNGEIRGTDYLSIGEAVALFGFPHADLGRTVLTYQAATVGARVLETSPAGVQTKMAILNLLSRPGQSGGPVISMHDASLLAVVIGAFAPAGGGGAIVGGVDPAALNQTTHVVSAEYLREMLNDVPA